MSKPLTAWCVTNRRGDLLAGTVAGMRLNAIKLMVGSEEGWRNRWRYWRRNHGCRCIRIRLVTDAEAK